jgi:hypothetical protein
MTSWHRVLAAAVAAVLLGVFAPLRASEPAPVDFAEDVQPILRRHCFRCHGSTRQEADLRLDLRDHVLGDAESGQGVVVRHDPPQSLLIGRLIDPQQGDLMPLDSEPLSPSEIALLRRWIAQGAPWPDALADAKHWAYQPVVRPELPESDAAQSPIDLFLLRKLQQRGLSFAEPLDRPRLLRRVSLALTGIPPTPEQVRQFVEDTSDDAYEKVVDRLLGSPRYGERWAVPWLDLARYADSNGFQADQIRDNWAYRDWVIRAFNDGLPFDQFVIDQIAGDLRDNASSDQKIATGFHRMTTCNVEAGVHPEANRVNQVVDRVNTTATVFLGTTLECAQCHDHKYDPFTQQDYYALFAYFNNTPLEVKNTAGVTWDFYGPTMDLPLDRQLAQLRKQLERVKPATTLVMVEMETPRETFVMLRGDYEQLGDRVAPATPAVLPRLDAATATGDRLELARWLVSPGNPLLPRVTVNRWWTELFGVGLVSTPEDFGTQGEAPSHPQLLDWLASELVESGWSMKHLHKRMVMSEAFQQSARVSDELLGIDPDNRLLARGPRFRLPAELLRDNALAISGLLSEKMYGPPIMPYQPDNLWRSVGRNQPKWIAAENEDRFRRGAYVVWKRAAPYPSFVNFDAPDRGSCTVSRGRSNTPLQALTLLNDPAYAEMSLALADRVLSESPGQDDESRINHAIGLALARPGSSYEISLLKELLDREREAIEANAALVDERTMVPFPAMQLRTTERRELAAWFAIANTLLNLDETMSQ